MAFWRDGGYWQWAKDEASIPEMGRNLRPVDYTPCPEEPCADTAVIFATHIQAELANQVTDSEDDSDTESSIGSMSRTSSVSHTFEVPSSKRPLAKPSGTKAKPTPVRRPIKKRAREESDDEVGGISRPAKAARGRGARGRGARVAPTSRRGAAPPSAPRTATPRPRGLPARRAVASRRS